MRRRHLGPRIPGIPYIVFEDTRDEWLHLVPDISSFTREDVEAVTRTLTPLRFGYRNWSNWVRLNREELVGFCRVIQRFKDPTMAKRPVRGSSGSKKCIGEREHVGITHSQQEQ